MQRCLFRFVAWVILAWHSTTWPVTLEPTAGISAPVALSGSLAARCVPDGRESIEDVAARERAGEFVALPALLLKGYTTQVCWLRFELERPREAPRNWFLEVGMPYLDDVTLFVPSRRGEANPGYTSRRLGDRFPYVDRPIPHRLFVFPLDLQEAGRQTVYLRIQTSSTMLIETLNLWQYTGLLRSTETETAVYWLVLGIVALGLLSNVVFWIWLRERIYAAYTLYLGNLMVAHLVNCGFATQFFWPHQPQLADRAVGFFASTIFLVGLHFFNEVFALRQSFPRLGKAIPVVLLFYAVCAVAAATGHYATVAPFLQSTALIVTACITVAGPWLLWHGKKDLWLYVLAFSTQLITAMAFYLRNLGLWPLSMPVEYFMLSTTAVHVVLLNFALAERVRHTQRDRLELESLSARVESEQRALKQQQEFMSMVAHEFRTPLTVIDTSAQRIAGQPQARPGKTAERCANIRAAVQRLLRLMDEFLTIDRMEGKIRQFAPVSSNVDSIVEGVLAEFGSQQIAARRNNLPEALLVDPVLLQVALSNLLSNALRFSPPGRPVLLAIDGLAHGGVTFSVTDEGPGIPADERPRVFEKYFRGRIGQSQPGAGLGLYLVDQVAKLHGGKAYLADTPGKHTCTVVLTIPSPEGKSRAH